MTSDVRVRAARETDAAILAEMANDLNDHVGVHGRPFTADRVRVDGFGPQAAFTPLIAEIDGAVAGYVFVSVGYNTDLAGRSMWLHDLFVMPANTGALEFYRRLGASGAQVRILGLDGERLRALAKSAP